MLDPIISPISNPLRVGPRGWILSNKLEKKPRKISNFTESASSVRWHPNDKWIFCVTNGNIASIKIKDGKTVMFSNDDKERDHLVVSRDGKTLAYVIPTPTKDESGKVVKDVSGKNFRQIFVLDIKI